MCLGHARRGYLHDYQFFAETLGFISLLPHPENRAGTDRDMALRAHHRARSFGDALGHHVHFRGLRATSATKHERLPQPLRILIYPSDNQPIAIV